MERNVSTEIDYDVLSKPTTSSTTLSGMLKFFGAGIYFGFVLVQSQVVSWFRIQEMFRFQSFHMYGVIGSAVVTGAICYALMRKLRIRSVTNEEVSVPRKPAHKGLVFGSLAFGVGWALTGACPGPIFAQIGMGFSSAWIVLISALAGTYVYGLLRKKLPH